MNSFQLATRRRGRNPCFWLLPLLFSLLSLHSEAAFSASLNVKIRQLNPDSSPQQVTCAENTTCVLPIEIQTGSSKEKLTVDVSLKGNGARFRFQTPNGYLYAADTNPVDQQNALYMATWGRTKIGNTASLYNLTLVRPAVPNAMTAPWLSIANEAAANVKHQIVANLELTAEIAP